VRATARLAGFPAEARIHDNVISADGHPALGDLRFQLVCCNAPFYTGYPQSLLTIPPEGRPKGLSQYWDGDTGEFIKRLASGLPLILDPERGVAVVWNRMSSGTVEHIFTSAGLDIRCLIFSGEDEDEASEVVYVVGSRPQTPP